MSKTGFWFGYPAHPDAFLAWGARAIFKEDKRIALEILYDRQGYFKTTYILAEDEKKFRSVIQKTILPRMQNIASYFSIDQTRIFVRHFACPDYPKCVYVAAGSPNGSYGYFFLSVSLVEKDKARPEEGPTGEKSSWQEMKEHERNRKPKRKASSQY